MFRVAVPTLLAGWLVISLGCSSSNEQTKSSSSSTATAKQDSGATPKAAAKRTDEAKKTKKKQPGSDKKKPDPIGKGMKAKQAGKQLKQAKGKKQGSPTTDTSGKKGKAQGPTTTKKKAKPTPKRFAARRLLLLAPGGPLVIELRMSIAGKPFPTSLNKLVDEALAAADIDKNGTATWSELTKSERFKYGQYGNLPFNDESGIRQLIRLYDINRNDIVDRDEVPRFLTRNYGGARPFSLRNWRVHFVNSRRGSAVLKWLDVDENGRLSTTEMAGVPSRLRSRDENDDEILTPAEFVDNNNDPRLVNMNRSGRRNGAQIAVELDKRVDWEAVHFAMQEQYSEEAAITKKDWPGLPLLFGKLDTDQNGKVSESELNGLIKLEPHLSFEIRFDEPGEERKRPAIKMTPIKKERFAKQPQVSLGNIITLQFARLEFLVFVNDRAPGGRGGQSLQVAFNRLDADKNKYLDEDEFPEGNGFIDAPFDALDLDKDGKVYIKDVERYSRGRFAAVRSQIRARISDDDDPLFLLLDKNNDGRLDVREIHGATERLKAIDKNKDGQISVREIPVSLSLAIARGNPQQGDRLFAIPGRQVTTNSKAPAWFQKMDENRDGEISRREFLGAPAVFKQRDTNADGFLSVQEATKK